MSIPAWIPPWLRWLALLLVMALLVYLSGWLPGLGGSTPEPESGTASAFSATPSTMPEGAIALTPGPPDVADCGTRFAIPEAMDCPALMPRLPTASEKFAVLVSAVRTTSDHTTYNSEGWYDLFLQYRMLVARDFPEDNIYVVFGRGADFNSGIEAYKSQSAFGHCITDLPLTSYDIDCAFQDIETRTTAHPASELYVWWLGHGIQTSAPDAECTLALNFDEATGAAASVGAGDLMAKVDLVSPSHYAWRVITVASCYSGGITSEIVADSKTILRSSTQCTPAYSAVTTCTEVPAVPATASAPASAAQSLPHVAFEYADVAAFRGKDPCLATVSADANHDDKVTFSEANVHAVTLAAAEETSPEPQIEGALATSKTP